MQFYLSRPSSRLQVQGTTNMKDGEECLLGKHPAIPAMPSHQAMFFVGTIDNYFSVLIIFVYCCLTLKLLKSKTCYVNLMVQGTRLPESYPEDSFWSSKDSLN